MAYEALKVRADLGPEHNPFSSNPLWARFAENRAKVRAKEAAELGGPAAAGGTLAAPRAPVPAASAAAPAPRASTGVPSFSKADVDKAAANARGAERQRIRTVFASAASQGRERLAADLLAAPEGFAASDIIAKLPAVAASLAAKAKAKADAVWERANAAVESRGRAPVGQASARATAKASAADGIWERANAAVEAQRSAAR